MRQSERFAKAQAALTRTPRLSSSKAKHTMSIRFIINSVFSSINGKVTNIPKALKLAALTALSSSLTAPRSVVIITILLLD